MSHLKSDTTLGYVGLYNYDPFKAYALLSFDRIEFIDYRRLLQQLAIICLPLMYYNNNSTD